jgi:hypothetical protein
MRDRLREIANTARHIRDLCVIAETQTAAATCSPDLADEIRRNAQYIHDLAARLAVTAVGLAPAPKAAE